MFIHVRRGNYADMQRIQKQKNSTLFTTLNYQISEFSYFSLRSDSNFKVVKWWHSAAVTTVVGVCKPRGNPVQPHRGRAAARAGTLEKTTFDNIQFTVFS